MSRKSDTAEDVHMVVDPWKQEKKHKQHHTLKVKEYKKKRSQSEQPEEWVKGCSWKLRAHPGNQPDFSDSLGTCTQSQLRKRMQ